MSTELVELPEAGSFHPWLANLELTGETGTNAQALPPPFDAADQYLLHEIARRGVPAGSVIVVANDHYGALATALAGQFEVVCYGDSFLSFEMTRANLAANNRSATFVPSPDPLAAPAGAVVGAVVVRIPKSLAFFEEQLLAIRSAITPGVPVLCGGMEKHLSRNLNALLDRLIGSSAASLGWRKARLVIATASQSCLAQSVVSKFPTTYQLNESPLPKQQLKNHANVFSRDGLDLGARALLPFLSEDLDDSSDPSRRVRVADLGCGNGVLGIISAHNNPDADYTFIDESYMAIRSAKENWTEQFGDRPAEFVVGDGLTSSPSRWFDVILCNPPFHKDHAVGDETAWRMFLGAHRSLAPDGSLLVVGNRHLNYHNKLNRLFGDVEQLGGNPKFVVLHARRD
jgi:23S rRNA (guanine1835-N2)-methyltransferase